MHKCANALPIVAKAATPIALPNALHHGILKVAPDFRFASTSIEYLAKYPSYVISMQSKSVRPFVFSMLQVIIGVFNCF